MAIPIKAINVFIIVKASDPMISYIFKVFHILGGSNRMDNWGRTHP